MLKITDKQGKLRYVLLDDAEAPESVDEIVLRDEVAKKEKNETETEEEENNKNTCPSNGSEKEKE